MYLTYKFYNEKGQRLTVIGYPSTETTIVKVLTCSHQDQFNKKKAKELLNKNLESISSLQIEGTSFRNFINYCNSTFYTSSNVVIAIPKCKLIQPKIDNRGQLTFKVLYEPK